MRSRVVRVGTRGSELALAQAHRVVERLREVAPGLETRVTVIHTEGDLHRDTPLHQVGGQGLFTGALERALQQGAIDVAVHSLKDLPSRLAEGLALAALLEREAPWDILVPGANLPLPEGPDPLAVLPRGARVGTSSLRRRAQLARARPDLVLLPLRGNVDTRLRKLAAGACDAIVLAAVGPARLGIQLPAARPLPPQVFVPAVGQGVIAVEARSDADPFLWERLRLLDHPPTRTVARAERAFLRRLGGGCRVPVGAFAELAGGALRLVAMIARPDGSLLLHGGREGPPERGEELGASLADELLDRGGRAILDEGG